MKRYTLSILGGALVLAGCGSGGEQVAGIDARGTPAPSAGIVSKGTITSFGSVTVNDVTFDTNSAMFTIDGSAGMQADLAVGHVVVVQGELGENPTTGTAETVSFDDAVEGPVSAVDVAAGTATVLGQLVRVDADTSFDDSISPPSLDGIAIDDVIEVSGFFLADGSIAATRIEPKPAGGEFELTGVVSNVGAMTFEINGFVVDFGGAMLENFPGGAPENGQLVEAKGDTLGATGELLATRVEFKGSDFGEDGDRAELEGFVTRFASATDFDVEGVPVTTDAQTVFENGSSADLALNRKVEVEGDITTTGVLDADSVEFKPSGILRIEGTVDDVQAAQLTVLGIVVSVNAATRYEDKSVADLESFDIGDINVTDYLEIRAYEDGGGVIATQIEREDFDGEVALRGVVESVNDPEFTILGVTIMTAAGTEFRDALENTITAAEFFAQAAGELVEASGTWNGNAIVADEVEFED